MASQCRSCIHPKRAEIDAALISGEPHRAIAARYGLAKASIGRHSRHRPELAQTRAELNVERERTVLEQVRTLIGKVESMLDAAMATMPEYDALGATKELGRLLELQAKLIGAFPDKTTRVITTDTSKLSREEKLAEVSRLKKDITAFEEQLKLEEKVH